MANLIIRKSASENISIPLTTEKPVARSLAVFKDGQIHYAPLVHSGDYLDSGVKVRINALNYALATQNYDPITHYTCGGVWTIGGSPFIHRRGYLQLSSRDYLDFANKVSITSSSYFFVDCSFCLSNAASGYWIFDFFASSTKRVGLLIRSDDHKAHLRMQTTSSNGTDLKTLSGVLAAGEDHYVSVSYDSGVWDCSFDGESLSPVTKALPAGDYTFRIGAAYNGGSGFVGELWDVSCGFNDIGGNLLFGN